MTKLNRLILTCFIFLLPLAVFPQEHDGHGTPVDHAAIAADTAHAAEAGDHGQAAQAEHGEEHGEHGGIGETLVHILAHHLVDSEELELFGAKIHLPVFTVGPLKFITRHQVWWLIAMLLVLLIAGAAARQKSPVPSGMRNGLEMLMVFIRDDVLKPNLHGWTDRFLPYFMSLFTCILFSNLLGLFPWGSSATGNVNVTAGLSLCSLGLMIGMGVRENGLMQFLHVFAPPGVPGWLMPLMVVVEIVSFLIRPFALTIRLFANMLAGHAVIAVLLGLIITPLLAIPSIGVAVGVMVLEILVAFIQAYIFAMLTAVFMGLAMHPH